MDRAGLASLGCKSGYGWYRLSLRSPINDKALIPESGDRLHVYHKGKLTNLLGRGPDADHNPANLRLNDDVTVLTDNLGRYSEGWSFGEQKGLFGHIYAVKSLSLGKPKITTGIAPDLFELGKFLPYVHADEQPIADTLSWKVKPVGSQPLIVEIDRLPWRAALIVNDQIVGAYDPDQSGGFARFVLHTDQSLKKGVNNLQLSVFGSYETKALPGGKGLAKCLKVHQATANLTAKAAWAFAKWSLPKKTDFKRLSKAGTTGPCWYHCRFKTPRAGTRLWIDPIGMTKGQMYLNGHNAGRYFVATHTGQSVPPQKLYYLPEPWLNTDGENELLLFDEHGKSPSRCRLICNGEIC